MLEGIYMSKKLDKLQRVIGKLKNHYGAEDEDVHRLQLELDALVALSRCPSSSRGLVSADKYNFQSLAKQQYYASRLENQY
jgi:hypothetical protein